MVVNALLSPTPNTSSTVKAIKVMVTLMRSKITRARNAVIRPPTNSTRPVPIKLRTPSTSLMMRETKNSGFVRIVKGNGQLADVGLHLAAEVGDHFLCGFGEQLREA